VRILLGDGWVDEVGGVHRATAGALRAKELALLRYLAARPGVTVGRAELYDAVWGYHPDTRSRTLDTTVRRVREAVEVDAAAPLHLVTDAGVGYRWVPAGGAADLAEAHVADGLRALPVGVPVALWGPPGVGKAHWCRAAGHPRVTRHELRPRTPGTHCVEVPPLPPAAARALVERRLRELGSTVACPDELSTYDGLPGALLAAADRADTLGRFEPPGPHDPVQSRFTEAVRAARTPRALGALAGFVGALPADVVAGVVGEGALGDWLDRGLVRREGSRLRVLAHARRAATEVDPAVREALGAAVNRTFAALHHPVLGLLRRSDSERAVALAADVTDPALAVRRARLLRLPLPSPTPDELPHWLFVEPDPGAILARLGEVDDPVVRGAARCLALRRSGRLAEALQGAPDPADRSLVSGSWHHQLAVCHAYAEHPEEAVRHLRAAQERWRGHDTLEGMVAGALGHSLVQLGRMTEAADEFRALLEGALGERIDGLLGLALVAVARRDRQEAVQRAREVRDLATKAHLALQVQVLQQVGVVFREVGDTDAARAVLSQGLRAAGRGGVPTEYVCALHHTLGGTLLDGGDATEALVHFAAADQEGVRPVARALSRCHGAFALELSGQAAEAARALAQGRASFPEGTSRTTLLVDALSPGADARALDDARAFALRTFDLALRAVADVAGGAESPELDDLARFSFEARLARRLRAARR
jgi:tetratricopeptide (TPR) repeat protein